jgi:hypothetical protein
MPRRALSLAARAAALVLLAAGLATAGPTVFTEAAHAVRATSGLTTSWFRVSAWASDPGTPRVTGAPAPGAAPADAPGEPAPTPAGMLAITSPIPLDIYAGGRRLGASGARRLVLPAGTHALEVISERYGYRGVLSVTVAPASVTTRRVALPQALLQVDTTPGAEVWVDGRLRGVAPLAAFNVTIGTRGVRVRHPELGERRTGVEIRYGVTNETALPFEPVRLPADAFPLPSLSRTR